MTTRSLLLAALACVAIAISQLGCANGTLALYPEFPDRKGSIKEAMLVADHVVLDRTLGDTAIVDLAENKNTAVAIMDRISDALGDRDYRFSAKLLSSMGLIMNQANVAKVVASADERGLSEERLGAQSPPFYVYRVFQKDSTLLRLLAGFYASLINTSKHEGDPNPVLKEAIPLGQSIGGDTWFVVLSGGYYVPAAREHGLLAEQQSLASEKISQHETTTATMMLYVVDMRTGELIWSDSYREIGGVIHRDRLLRIAGRLVSSLP